MDDKFKVVEDRLNMSLDEIIKYEVNSIINNKQNNNTEKLGTNNRKKRKLEPFNENKSYDCAIKVLLNNALIGSMMGTGGSAKRELSEISGANVYVSSSGEFFPGTQLRIVFITGTITQVSSAQRLLWEMIGQQEYAKRNGMSQFPWRPTAMKANPGEYHHMKVQGHISVPDEGCRVLVGKQGSTLKSIMSRSGAQIIISPKEEGAVISERLLTISGTVADCMNATSMIISKLMELDDGCEFQCSGCRYPGSIYAAAKAAGIKAPRNPEQSRTSNEFEYDDDISSVDLTVDNYPHVPGVKFLSASIELALSKAAVGAIIGKQGVIIDELTALSGATIKISNRGEYVEGTRNRLVTITGSPAAVQTAHTLVLQKVRQLNTIIKL